MKDNNNFQSKKGFWLAILILIVGGSLLLSACGAKKPKEYRVGILVGVDAFTPVADGFKAKMAELGYVEGENIVYDFQSAQADAAKMKEISEKFVADEVDLILAITNGAALTAKAATEGTDIPVVFAVAQTEGVSW